MATVRGAPDVDDQVLPPGYVGNDPMELTRHWRLQAGVGGGAVAAEECVLDAVTGGCHREADTLGLARRNGWFSPGAGTAAADLGRVLEAHGVTVVRHDGAGLVELVGVLAAGRHVIVGFDAARVDALGHPPSAVQQGCHGVQVIGIDNTDVAHPVVVVNDPGVPDGNGASVPLPEFLAAWRESGGVMVTVRTRPTEDG